MNKLFTAFLILMNVVVFGNNTIPIEKLRVEYITAIEDSDVTDKLLNQLSHVSSNTPVLYAYKGALEALVAKHSWNPYTKYEYLAKAMKTLDIAIEKEKNNAEMRFLRFSIQHYVPSFLGFSNNLDEDKKIILANLKYSNSEVKEVIKNFLITSGRCTEKEKNLVRNI